MGPPTHSVDPPLQTLNGFSGPVGATFSFHGRLAGGQRRPVADIGGSLAVTGHLVIDKGGPLPAIGDPLASIGGHLANTGNPLADTRGRVTWDASWMSQEALWSTQEAPGETGGPLADTRA